MKLSEKQIELIGLYLQGRLEGDALSIFLEEVDQNPSLKEEVEIQKSIQEGIEHRNNLELRSMFNKIAEKEKIAKKETKVISIPFLRILASVAAVALLCFAAYFLLQSPSDTDSLYAQYFEPSELTITRSTDLDADLVNVNELYNTKKYDKALPLFKKVIDVNPSSSNLRLAYGNTLLKCNKIILARQQFEYIIKENDPLFIDQSRWYLALLELKEGNVKSAKNLLSILADDSNSDFHSEAQALLSELNDMK